MNATDATADTTEAQPLWMGVLGVCLGITGSFFSTLSRAAGIISCWLLDCWLLVVGLRAV